MGPFLTGLLGGLASNAGNSTVSGGVGSLFNSAKKQWKYKQKEMALQQQYVLEQMDKAAQYQLQHDQQMFDYENAYNEPTKIFDRFRAAGISPAAVLGSSGVGVSATVPTGSGGSPSGSAPHSTGSYVTPFAPTDASSVTQIMQAESVVNRNQAAAARDSAEAQSILNQTQSKEYYASIAALNKSITEANVSNATAVADMNRALADIYSIDADFQSSIKTMQLNDLTALWAKHNEEYHQLKKYNVEYMDKVMSAQLALDFARAYQASTSGDLNTVQSELFSVQVADLQNWFELNWTTKIDVPEVDDKGKPTGKTVQMTGREIQEYLLGISVTEAQQGISSNWYKMRSQKNAFGYQMANTALHGALQIAGAATIAGRAGAASSAASTIIDTERYDRSGEFIGGTRVEKRQIRGKRK